MDRWKVKTQEEGGKVSEDAIASAFLDALRKLNETERVIQQIKSECIPKRERLTKRLAQEIIESGLQGRGIFEIVELIFFSFSLFQILHQTLQMLLGWEGLMTIG